MLHGLVESIVHCVLDVDVMPDEEASPHQPGFEALKADMFNPAKGDILTKILAAYKASEEQAKLAKHGRLGFMGHLIRICAGISDMAPPQQLSEWGVSETQLADWLDLCDKQLAADITAQQTILGGQRPGGFGQEDDFDGLDYSPALDESLQFSDAMLNNSTFLDSGGLDDDDDFFNWGADDDQEEQ
jgi:hypothetical protein